MIGDGEKMAIDVRAYNSESYAHLGKEKHRWTVPVSSEEIAAARQGQWSVLLTDTKPAPANWFPKDLHGLDILCLAGGGGQQGPILAAAGANVTVFDISLAQLEQDRYAAQRDDLRLTLIQGDMTNLSAFDDASFHLIVHPASNTYVPDVRPVWKEAFRVLRPGGLLLAGFENPVIFIFDQALAAKGQFAVKYSIPYSDLTSISEAEREKKQSEKEPLEFGHTLEDQIGGQLDAGFVITGFYDDYLQDELLAQYMPTSVATRAMKPLAK